MDNEKIRQKILELAKEYTLNNLSNNKWKAGDKILAEI